MDLKTIAYDTKEGFENEDRIYQTGYLLYEIETNRVNLLMVNIILKIYHILWK